MKKVILFMAGILVSMMLNAQSRWSVTPEAGCFSASRFCGN